MSLSTPPKGTHFSDGVRMGPILGSQFVAGANVLTPSTQVSGPVDQQPPGIFATPMSLYDTIPTPVVATSVVTTVTPVAAGYLPLNTVNALGITIMTYQSFTNVIKLDVPRNITFTSAGNTATTITINGWDQYGQPMSENVTGPNANTTSGKKAFMYIKRIYDSVGSGVAYTVGVGNTFGLGHLVTNSNYIGIPEWNGQPDLSPTSNGQAIVGPLANNPLTTGAAGSSIVTVTATAPQIAALVSGELVTITGATTTDGITAAQLNITAVLTVVDATHFSYVSDGNATTGGTAGGGAAVFYQVGLTGVGGAFVAGDEHPATAITGDVRGTYTPTSNADGTKRLTINYYSASGDARNYINGSTGSVILNLNPLSNVNTQTTINVFAPNHQYTTGEFVTISGGVGNVGGITPAQYNLTRTSVTVVDANNFTYNTGIAGTGGTSGGAVVLMSPQYGNLYQNPVGRFGVTQFFSVALF